MNKPELGPPPVFEEEMNCDHQCGFCKSPFSRLHAHYSQKLTREISTLKAGGVGVLDQLQAETQRADKAKAEVIELRGQLLEAKYAFDCLAIESDEEPFIDYKQTAQVFRQKLCDEIVGKIKEKQEAIIKEKPWLDSDGYWDSIDIVKSVLSEDAP